MARRFKHLYLAMFVLVSPSPLLANGGFVFDFSNACTLGSLTACASVTVDVAYLGDGTSILAVRIRNLEGTLPLDDTGGWSLGRVDIGIGTESNQALGITEGPEGSVGEYGTPYTRPNPFGGDPVPGIADTWHVGPRPYRTFSFQAFGHGIVGCTQVPLKPGNPGFVGAFQTCPGAGYDGAFLIRFRVPFEVDPNTMFVAWTGGGGRCDSRDPTLCQVIPEPLTLALVASGLAAMGGIGAVKRRRNDLLE